MKRYFPTLFIGTVLAATTASAQLSLKVTENGFGWQQRVDPPESASPIIDLSQGSVDWMVPNNTDGIFDGFNYFARKANGTLLQFLGVGGDYYTVGSNSVDSMQVYFTATDAVVPLPDGSHVEIGELGIHFGVSWMGSNDGSGRLTWRMEVNRDAFNVFHWWNHGSGFQSQTFRVTWYNAAGEALQTESYLHDADRYSAFFSEILIQGNAIGDFIIFEQEGYNAGWRGTVVFPAEASGPQPGDWIPHAQLGSLYYFGGNWYWSELLQSFYLPDGDGWWFHPTHGWLSLPVGDLAIAAETGFFMYRVSSSNFIWASATDNGRFHDFASQQWLTF
jgi:hypothetical protein